MRRGLTVILVACLTVCLRPGALDVAEAVPLAATPSEPVFGVATGSVDEPGSMNPTGNGRFTIEDRAYSGKSLAKSVSDDAASCLTGQFRTDEDWALESPRMTGSHRSVVTVRSDHGTVSLRLRGRMEFPTASGTWEITRATGDCSDLEGEGAYSATFPTGGDGSPFRLAFEGQVHS